jgi:hypothetical protein
VIDKPNFFANPTIISNFKIPGEMNPNSTSNNYPTADFRPEKSEESWPQSRWKER